jgi:hypothetical protein
MKKTIAHIACTVMLVLPAMAFAVSAPVADGADAGHQTAAMVLAGLMIMATIVRRRRKS